MKLGISLFFLIYMFFFQLKWIPTFPFHQLLGVSWKAPKKVEISCLQIFPKFLSPIFLKILKLSQNFKTDWVATLDKGSCPYSFYRTRRHFKNFEREIHYICQSDNKEQARILFQFLFAYMALHRSKRNIWKPVTLCYELVPGFQNTLFSKSQTNQNKQRLILIFFLFIAFCSYYHKIRLASLET